jgi:hypothetical protein
MKINFWFGLLLSLFFLLSVGGLIGGSIMIFKNIDLRLFGIKTMGKIVEYETSSSRTNRDYKNAIRIHYYPVVEYIVNGKTLKFKSHSSADDLHKGKGEEVEIVYRLSEPEYFELQSQLRQNLIAGIVCIFIGGIFTAIISLLAVQSFKEKRKAIKKKLFEEHNSTFRQPKNPFR